jgi:hypothetical protein
MRLRTAAMLVALGLSGCIATLGYDDYEDAIPSDGGAGASGSGATSGASGASGSSGTGGSAGSGGTGASGGSGGAGASGGSGGGGGSPDCNDDPAACNDSDPCTQDVCESGTCIHPPTCPNSACCVGECRECCTDSDCSDFHDCTVDHCVGGTCVRTPDDAKCELPLRCDVTNGCIPLAYDCSQGTGLQRPIPVHDRHVRQRLLSQRLRLRPESEVLRIVGGRLRRLLNQCPPSDFGGSSSGSTRGIVTGS